MQIKKSESTGTRTLYTGFFNGKVLAVNPSQEKLAELLGYTPKEDAKEFSYESKDKDGNEVVTVSFWLQADTAEKQWFNARFRLVDKVQVNKEGTKTQFVNATGGSSWTDKKENLLDWFSHFQDKDKKNIADKYVREAIQGEANLYTFLRAWLAKVSFFDVETNILIDVKKIFRNVDKYVEEQFKPLIDAQIAVDNAEGAKKSELAKELLTAPVVALAVVYTGDKDGEVVHYQNLYQEFLGSYMMKKVSFALSSNNWTADKGLAKWHEQVTGQHGCKDSYKLCMLEPFDENNHQQATNNLFVDNSGANADPNDTSY